MSTLSELRRIALIFALGAVTLVTAAAQSLLQGNNQESQPAASGAAVSTPAARHYHPNLPPKRAAEYYGLIWGVDGLRVKAVESGELIRFTYHVVDAGKAEALNDKKFEPSLIDPQAGVSLQIPQLEKVGKLRQSSSPETGKIYWMAFSNKGRLVKPGHHVSVVIGNFHADGLIVE
jgi:hypothetical protein